MTLLQTHHMIIRTLLRLIPQRLKLLLYGFATRYGIPISPGIHRLPCGLVLKITSNDPTGNEAAGLGFIQSLQGVNAPHLIDVVCTPSAAYLLSTWISGDCCGEIWEQLTESDKERLVAELRTQFSAIRRQTADRRQLICTASGAPICDPRIPWFSEESPRVLSSCQDFLAEVWVGLTLSSNIETIRPIIQPLIERQDIPIIFCHGDLLPRNLILPGGLKCWRAGSTAVFLIDWEYSGWMPVPWEALKATWLCCDYENEWYVMMRRVFPESLVDLDADWEWRSKSRITIL
ncbi:protein kinase subdomain-containing protein PKL [Cristinia sonorae]|uniref:Protein kinase subdomain-containing protein PKL n=1 Tax=Cristinia sonorae TaxID=1940300 RepID=A0A8K0UID4_9AGAR|nr:protein kinase subdomain-containing protein PKL [Cristinia sonorae]